MIYFTLEEFLTFEKLICSQLVKLPFIYSKLVDDESSVVNKLRKVIWSTQGGSHSPDDMRIYPIVAHKEGLVDIELLITRLKKCALPISYVEILEILDDLP